MKEADEHKFQSHDGKGEFEWHPEYTFEIFCKSPMALFAWAALEALSQRPAGTSVAQQPGESPT